MTLTAFFLPYVASATEHRLFPVGLERYLALLATTATGSRMHTVIKRLFLK